MANPKKIKRKRSERGSSLFESLIAIILLCLIFFGGMQLFHFAMSKMVCEYAAFNGAKALSLGYARRIVDKTIRLSSLGISGKDESNPTLNSLNRHDLRSRMQLYMMTGHANVDFAYWDPMRSNDPELRFNISNNVYNNDLVDINVGVENAPLLTEDMANFFQMGFDSIYPRARVVIYDHSRGYLE